MSSAIDDALQGFAGPSDDAAMAAVAIAARGADAPQLARLTQLLAESGERLGPPSPDVVDIASSGGPGSLSTLLGPLYACALGARVAKVAVPGRPAGGLDVLASLPGYRPDLDGPAAREVLGACGYVHVAAGGAFCPLDGRFFAWRQANGAQAVPELVITSLLAKKLAAGVGRVVLDIRVGPYGNLGTTSEEARGHAKRLVAVAAELGITAICVLTGAQGAPQPWIGRGEALVALARVLDDNPDDALREHADQCLRMALIATNGGDPPAAAVVAVHARGTHESMLTAHGASPEAFWSRERAVATAHRHTLLADRQGTVNIALGDLRRVLVDRQRAAASADGARFSDPCGVHLGRLDGAAVMRGDVLARVRDDVDGPAQLADQIAPHLRVVDEPPQGLMQAPMEIIRG